MTPLDEFHALCAKWETDRNDRNDRNAFKDIVTLGVGALGVPVRDLANDMEVNDSTVSRWASGVARPHPKIQGLVVRSLKKRVAQQASRPENV